MSKMAIISGMKGLLATGCGLLLLVSAAAAQEAGGVNADALAAVVPPDILAELKVVEEDGRRLVEASLGQVLRMALERNQALEAIRMEEQLAESRLTAARSTNHPTLTNSLSHTRSLSASASSSGDYLSLYGSNATTLNSTYSKKLSSGVTMGLSYTETRLRSQSGSIPAEGEDPVLGPAGDWWDTSALKGSVNIPLGKGLGSAINDLSASRSEVGLSATRVQVGSQIQALLARIASTYWDLVGLIEVRRIQADAVKLSETLLADNQARLATGVLSPMDVQVTRTQLARDRQRLLSVRLDVLRIEDQVRALLGLEALSEYGLKPRDVPEARRLDYDQKALLGKALASDPDVLGLQSALELNNLDMVESRNNDRTDLDLDLYYTFYGYSSDPLGGVSQFSQTKTDGYGVTLTWTVPLFDHSIRESMNQRSLERQQLELQLSSLRSDLTVRLQSLLGRINLAEKEVETARITVSLVEEQLQNEIERFRLGQSTSFRVSQAQQDAAQARVDEILARVRFEKNYLELLVLTGTLLPEFNL